MVGALSFDNASFRYAREPSRPVLDSFDLTVAPGEFVCLLGPSGAGKSTALALAAGLRRPSSGRVLWDGREINGPSVERGLLMQKHALFPWLSARDNVEFGPRLRGVGAADRRREADELLAAVGLQGREGDLPARLSEGQRQRVALARALANEPRLLLMDEPFASLDALTRRRMQDLLLSVWSRRRPAVLFVTHDADEALRLGDRAVVMSSPPGRAALSLDIPRPRLAQAEGERGRERARLLEALGA